MNTGVILNTHTVTHHTVTLLSWLLFPSFPPIGPVAESRLASYTFSLTFRGQGSVNKGIHRGQRSYLITLTGQYNKVDKFISLNRHSTRFTL